ncbi:uncharacterized protein BYT42DRAFT_609584 [Radiomyces spectabilis]|uniref:uncharacterized protein n=1 Tax=Radiomyces spectabilis TaxID=64574 RepID=UPI002220B7AA|nr:uncharacterized protein BYT42DRAFT_609584 [Radiomyces spectabilis]KAI8393818.1 hypothetical protein BYT42DRAFT_609584 [Radiomyces spectabilis]
MEKLKRESERRHHYLVNRDLIRLALFTKKSIDDDSFATRTTLAIHTTGSTLTLYLLKIQSDGLNIMTELAQFQVPMAGSEIPSFLAKFTTLKMAFMFFSTNALHCQPKAMPILHLGVAPPYLRVMKR